MADGEALSNDLFKCAETLGSCTRSCFTAYIVGEGWLLMVCSIHKGSKSGPCLAFRLRD